MLFQHAILHILDKTSGNLILSQKELTLSDPTFHTYLEKLCKKILNSDPKMGQLDPESDLALFMSQDESAFIPQSCQLAEKLFQLIAPAEEIPAADYLFFRGVNDAASPIIGIIRLDYSTQYAHFLAYDENDLVQNQLIQNHAILPAPSQKPSEAFLLNLDTFSFHLLEKSYVIEGKKRVYFSTDFLEIPAPNSTGEQLRAVKKMVTQVSKKFNEEPYTAMASTQQAILQQLEESHEINTTELFETVFQHNSLAKEATKELAKEEKIPATISVSNVPTYEKKYSKQKFKLANGIELTIPSDIYQDKSIIEFLNNPDGSISVVIKNIDNILTRFPS